MRALYPDDQQRDPDAEPGVSPEVPVDPDAASVTLHVEGEVFSIRQDTQGGTDYTWLSGPDPGYGFSLSPARDLSLDEHRANICRFLEDIDPTTGYLKDE